VFKTLLLVEVHKVQVLPVHHRLLLQEVVEVVEVVDRVDKDCVFD